MALQGFFSHLFSIFFALQIYYIDYLETLTVNSCKYEQNHSQNPITPQYMKTS